VVTISAITEPVTATLWAALFLGESLTWPQVVGDGLVIAGGGVTAVSVRVVVSTFGGLYQLSHEGP